ncbi:hypothetical protein, partial [Gemmatimonas sp.]|uniref:hypothetical protein n=1 Tax=Gemmatimonas sp. TaxID=1962908 RepID=UPI0025C0A47C
AAREYVEATQPAFALALADVDPRDALQRAAATWRARAPMVPVHVDEPTVLLPTMRTDPGSLERTLELAIGLGVAGASLDGGQVRAGIRLGRGFLAVQVAWDGRPVFEEPAAAPGPSRAAILRIRADALRWSANDVYADARCWITAVDLPLARALASRQGGELRVELADTADATREVLLVFPVVAETHQP